MTAAHTPGDWRVWAWTQREPDGTVVACGHQVVSRLPDDSEVGIFTTATEGEDVADLHLIAAAPALLAACVKARDMLVTDRQAFVDCNRVQGSRTEDAVAHGLVWVDEDTWIEPSDAEPLREYDRAIALIDAAIAKAVGRAA